MLSFSKKYNIILLIVLLAIKSFSSYAQDNYKIGLNLSTRWSRQINPNYQQDRYYTFWLNGMGASVVKPLKLNSRFSFESGLSYLHASSTFSELEDLRFTYTPEGEIDGYEVVGTMELTEKYNFLSLPLLGHYTIIDTETVKLTLFGGVLLDLLINRKNHYDTTFDGKRTQTFATGGLEARKINKVIRLGFGIEKRITNRLSIVLSPSTNIEFMSSVEEREDFASIGANLYILYLR